MPIAMAEALQTLCTTGLIRNKGTSDNINDPEIVVAVYIDWHHHRQPHGKIGYIPCVGTEIKSSSNQPSIQMMQPVEQTLHQTWSLTDACTPLGCEDSILQGGRKHRRFGVSQGPAHRDRAVLYRTNEL